ncbi:MAG TPA: glycerophosphodiester phosphodiesterase [Candidatus Binatia bacterium]|nr:glycerophosphodiester phosphodiesterase [Candidatus Binatia bacterium]
MDLRRGARPVVRIGHRGAPGVAAENTLESLEAAIELGVDAVEIDVARGVRGTAVLSHERGRRVPAGAVPLDDALDWLAERDAAVQLDLKDRGLEPVVAEAVRRHGLLGRAYVSTPRFASLRAVAALDPSLGRALTIPDDRLHLSRHRVARPVVEPSLAVLRRLLPHRLPRLLRSALADAATLDVRLVTADAIRACHETGAAVYVWTVDDAALAHSLVEAGADGIITNDPRIFEGFRGFPTT